MEKLGIGSVKEFKKGQAGSLVMCGTTDTHYTVAYIIGLGTSEGNSVLKHVLYKTEPAIPWFKFSAQSSSLVILSPLLPHQIQYGLTTLVCSAQEC